MSDLRARVVLDAPVNEGAMGLLTLIVAREIAEEVRAVFQNALIAKGIGTRYESDSSAAQIHTHDARSTGACPGCLQLAQDARGNF